MLANLVNRIQSGDLAQIPPQFSLNISLPLPFGFQICRGHLLTLLCCAVLFALLIQLLCSTFQDMGGKLETINIPDKRGC